MAAPGVRLYETLDRVDVYDLATGSWRTADPMPVATRSAGSVQVGPQLYVVGGHDRNAAEPILDAVQRLDLTTGDWSLGPPLAQPRADLGVAATDRALYALGGTGDFPFGEVPTPTVQRLAYQDWDGGAWDQDAVPELPLALEGNGAGFCTRGRAGGEIWSVGGPGSGAHRALFLPVPGERCPTITADLGWLEVAGPDHGTVRAHGRDRLTVVIDGRQLRRDRTYTATLLVTTTDPGVPEVRIPVTVRVR